MARIIGNRKRAFSPRTPGGINNALETKASTGASGIVNRAYGDLTPQMQALGLIMLTLGPIDHVLPHERTTHPDP